MHAWTHDIDDILIITYNDVEQPARVVGYVDSLDNSKPLYVNLRVSGGLRWGVRNVKIQPAQIIREDKEWHARQKAAFDASIQEVVDRMPEQRKQLLLAEAERRRNRSPLDILIDRAVGRE